MYYLVKFLLLIGITFVDSAISDSEQCVKNGEICGYSNQTNILSSCCDGYKCVTTERVRGMQCIECAHIVYPFKCLRCTDNFNDHCGGPDKLQCCPITGLCVTTNYSDPDAFGKCLPPP